MGRGAKEVKRLLAMLLEEGTRIIAADSKERQVAGEDAEGGVFAAVCTSEPSGKSVPTGHRVKGILQLYHCGNCGAVDHTSRQCSTKPEELGFGKEMRQVAFGENQKETKLWDMCSTSTKDCRIREPADAPGQGTRTCKGP